MGCMTVNHGTENLTDLSAATLVDRLRAQELSPTDVVDAFTARIKELNPGLGAFNFVTEEHDDVPVSPGTILAGLPQAAKDIWDVKGMPTTHGTAALPDYVADADSPAMAALREAGATFVGKTQVPEFALNAYSENLIAPPARNPLDPERTAGGSSGGTAAAIAAKMLPAALGNDGGGSVRIPAAACGLIGLKPGRGTVPADDANVQPEILGTVAQLTCTGPLGRDAEDAGLMMDALMGRTDGYFRAAGRAGMENGFTGSLSVGVSTATPFTPDIDISLNWAALVALNRAAAQLARNGHDVAVADIRYQPGYAEYFTTVWTSALQRNPVPGLEVEKLTELTASFARKSADYTQEYMDHCVAELTALAENAVEQLGEYDIVLTPMLAIVPPKIGEFTALSGPEDYRLQCQFTPYTSMVNVFGLPAISVPVYQDPRSDLTWSVQLIGRTGSEAQLLMLAGQLHTQLMTSRS